MSKVPLTFSAPAPWTAYAIPQGALLLSADRDSLAQVDDLRLAQALSAQPELYRAVEGFILHGITHGTLQAGLAALAKARGKK